MSEVSELIDGVERARAELLAAASALTEVQAAWRPAEGQWSAIDVLEHLYLAELSGIAKIAAALDTFRSGHQWTDARPNQGKHIDAIVAATWKPRETAPPIATPHIGGPLCFWLSATRSLRPVLADLGATLAGVTLEDVVYPHFLCGPLDARQRLEFLRFHIDRHVAQIARIRDSAGFPG